MRFSHAAVWRIFCIVLSQSEMPPREYINHLFIYYRRTFGGYFPALAIQIKVFCIFVCTLLLGRCRSGTANSENMEILLTSVQGGAPTPAPTQCFISPITLGITDLLNSSQHGGCEVLSYHGSNLDFLND